MIVHTVPLPSAFTVSRTWYRTPVDFSTSDDTSMEGVRPETADAPSGGRWHRLDTQRPCGKAEGEKGSGGGRGLTQGIERISRPMKGKRLQTSQKIPDRLHDRGASRKKEESPDHGTRVAVSAASTGTDQMVTLDTVERIRAWNSNQQGELVLPSRFDRTWDRLQALIHERAQGRQTRNRS